jgi:hypothetical protein
MALSSFPPTLNHSNMTYSEKVSDFHLIISSMLAHMFFMKMDWVTSRGLPCGSYTQILRKSRLYTRLVNSWQTLNCLYQRSLLGKEVSISVTEMESNTALVVNTPVRRYTNCQARRIRDCVLLEEAGDVLNRIIRLYGVS